MTQVAQKYKNDGAKLDNALNAEIATRLIRQSSRPDHDIPIFAMTANTFASDRRSCREAGMTSYIPKPVSVKNIEEALTVIEK